MARTPKKPPAPGEITRMFEEMVGAPMDEWPDPDALPDEDPISELIDLFVAAEAEIVSPPILQPADVFLDTAGEDIRRRLFVTTGADGEELCLRPDFTIPVCREYLSRGVPGRVATMAYMGSVFRQRPGESGEFQQAGIERFGETDRPRADAEIFRMAIEATELFDVLDPEIQIGDEGLFTALLEALELPLPVRRRLRSLFGDRAKLEAGLEQLVARDGGDIVAHAGFLGALAGANPEAARAVVEDLLAIAGITAVGGRTAHEIADRFLQQAALKAEGGLTREKADTIGRFLTISGDPVKAARELDRFQREMHIDIAEAVATFRARSKAMKALGIDLASLAFRADFGRNLDYYTGFVFEIRDPARRDGKPVVGGGRYDGLIERLGARVSVPAVGFSMWLDRLAGVELDGGLA
ncbi:ATP phosphoribosyltransferase regulatory subunit [Prosthecomicrobium hirschii]|uniref:ATP phosphoribosyltransferase regulatory subunit n=1 Tax=Prosthecodimorpha hirschii TaxID=665126 RepID=UPI000AD202EF|nr:ATP phosphoribosyltransferase regulatory subunit [Prosthecomicrobium hirschii]MCW1840862.1 ATP phosphoribosyltransferase regulatory subunit [Prosthecomicrobium hirschii]